MNIRPAFITNPQAAVLAQPGEGAFYDPAMNAQATAMRRPAVGQERDNAAAPQLASMRLRVIGSVPQNRLGMPTRPSHFARDGRDGIDQRQQLRDVIAVGPRDLDRQRNAVRRGQEMVLGARLAAIRGIGAGLGPPKTARMELESTGAREKSIWSASRSSLSKTRWIWRQTPAFCQSRRRRQQVMPLPQPISWGRSSQGTPLRRTNRMPVNTARLSRGFRPGCRNRLLFTGSKGLIKSHSRSSTIGLAISVAPFPGLLPSRKTMRLATDIYVSQPILLEALRDRM
jgi:hypothetical protein